MKRQHKFLVQPSSDELGPIPDGDKMVEYEVTFRPSATPGQSSAEIVTEVHGAPFGEPIDLDLDVEPNEPIETRVRFRWADSERLREYRDCYRSW
jgi:hypothetical protein